MVFLRMVGLWSWSSSSDTARVWITIFAVYGLQNASHSSHSSHCQANNIWNNRSGYLSGPWIRGIESTLENVRGWTSMIVLESAAYRWAPKRRSHGGCLLTVRPSSGCFSSRTYVSIPQLSQPRAPLAPTLSPSILFVSPLPLALSTSAIPAQLDVVHHPHPDPRSPLPPAAAAPNLRQHTFHRILRVGARRGGGVGHVQAEGYVQGCAFPLLCIRARLTG
ncbi:hypothetical protein CALVIDRAFT_313738 [Calocera viscosa TUFC12733]|uniref:Reverse transcriptase domain-containing protein n=1 Tax=Calocera viscosa (strain TUFC12733) TaxID=1330018 RepID=A0A167HZV4_CALVF|nr:hypothetical protein CALVIDRAFT_313738 [Calocera viscosa TUFC12733]